MDHEVKVGISLLVEFSARVHTLGMRQSQHLYESCTVHSTTTLTSSHPHTIRSHPHTFTDELPDLNDTCYDKVALLIGNKKYHQGQLMLNTPENDTQDLAGVLRSAGFKVVSLVNLTKIEMDQVLQ